MRSKDEDAEASPRQVLSENLVRLMTKHETLTSIKKVAAATKDFRLNGEDVHLSNGTVGRIAAGSHPTSIDNLHSLAKAFGLEPWQLLVRGLNPSALPRLADAAVLHQILDAVRGPAATPSGNSQPAIPAHPVESQSQSEIDRALAIAMRGTGRKKGEAGQPGGVQKPRARRRP